MAGNASRRNLAGKDRSRTVAVYETMDRLALPGNMSREVHAARVAVAELLRGGRGAARASLVRFPRRGRSPRREQATMSRAIFATPVRLSAKIASRRRRR